MDYVRFRRGKWEVRIGVPKELRRQIGKTELLERLDSDWQTAKSRAPATVARFFRELDAAKATLADTKPNLREAARRHYERELRADMNGRAAVGNYDVAEFNSLFAPHRVILLRMLVAGRIDDDEAEALMGYAVDDLIAEGKVSAEISAKDRRDLLRALAEVQLDAMARFEERDQGRAIVGEPRSEHLREPELDERAPMPAPANDRRSKRGKTLSELLTLFHEERTAGQGTITAGTQREHVTTVRMLEEFLGRDRAAASITKDDMREFKQALLRLPNRYVQRFPGMTIRQAIDANSKRKEPFGTIDPKTINEKYLAHTKAILGWAARNGHIANNPAEGVKVETGNGFQEPRRLPFSADDLVRIFGSPLFANPRDFGSKQWALLIALYTGARSSSEFRRIKFTDIYEEQGVLVFNLEEASKNVQSKRIVPVHSRLKELGLLEYVAKLKKAGRDRLFWDWEPEDKINRWFLRTYKAEVGVTEKRKVFHSFRNTLLTALARHGVNRDLAKLIAGHQDQSVSGGYIHDQHVTMVQAMSNGLERVRFEALDSIGK